MRTAALTFRAEPRFVDALKAYADGLGVSVNNAMKDIIAPVIGLGKLSSNSPRTPFTFAQTKNEGLSVASVSAPDGVTVAVLSSGYMKLAFPESLRKRARIRGEVSAEPFCWTRRAGSRARASARFSTS